MLNRHNGPAPRDSRTHRRYSLSSAALTLGFSLLASLPLASAADMVIATAKTPSPLAVSNNTLTEILSGKITSWPDGSPITLVLPPTTSAERTWLCEDHLGIPVSQHLNILIGRVARGGSPQLIQVKDSEAVRDQLLATPGSVGPLAETELSPGLVAIQAK